MDRGSEKSTYIFNQYHTSNFCNVKLEKEEMCDNFKRHHQKSQNWESHKKVKICNNPTLTLVDPKGS